LGISCNKVVNTFVKQGLFLRKYWISRKKFYYYVTYDELLKFLKNNQNVWDSTFLEENALGAEWEWLRLKRQKDKVNNEAWQRIISEKEFNLINFMYQCC